MRVDGWSKIRESDAMNLPADIMARRSTERIKKTIMTTAEHDQLSGMKRTEELKRGMAAAAAAEERKRLRGMPGLDRVETSKRWDRQVKAEIEARVPEEVRQPQAARMFEKGQKKKTLPDFSNLKGVTDYGPDGGGSGRSGSFGMPSFWESSGQAAAGGAARSLGTQMDVWGTQYQRWQPGRS